MKSRQLTQLRWRLGLQVGVGGLGASTYPTVLSCKRVAPRAWLGQEGVVGSLGPYLG